jgi:hypothetical protein
MPVIRLTFEPTCKRAADPQRRNQPSIISVVEIQVQLVLPSSNDLGPQTWVAFVELALQLPELQRVEFLFISDSCSAATFVRDYEAANRSLRSVGKLKCLCEGKKQNGRFIYRVSV